LIILLLKNIITQDARLAENNYSLIYGKDMIITNDEALLRVHCEPVLPDEVGGLVEILENELNEANRLGRGGIGLAAPQIGIAKDIAIIRLNKSNNLNFNLVNCKLTRGYDPLIFRQEGCLSFPGRVENTTRFQEVHITNNLVYPHDFVTTGMLAVVCQHELDHLNQKLFIDHVLLKQPVSVSSRQKPNDRCACGSAIKYKKCCGKKGI
jgi:peptide deformylase